MEKLFNLNSNLIQIINKQYQVELGGKLDENAQKKNDYAILKETESLQLLKTIISKENLTKIIEIAFQQSFEYEESRFHNFSIILCPPVTIENDNSLYELSELYIFEKPRELSYITKLASCLENTNRKFCVWFNEESEPIIWAFGNYVWEYMCLEIKTFSAGQIVIKIPYISYFTSSHFIVSLSKVGFVDKISIFNEIFIKSDDFDSLKETMNVIAGNEPKKEVSKEALSKQFHQFFEHSKYFEEIAIRMKQHSHGGTILVIYDETNWTDSIQHPIPLKSKVNFDSLKKNIVENEEKFISSMSEKERAFSLSDSSRFLSDERIALLNLVGQLTSVDGATIITRNFELLAFGAKIKPINSSNKPFSVIAKEPFEDAIEKTMNFSDIGGTRHQSAAQFVYDQKKAFAIVASQDGKISVMYWDADVEIVRIIQHAEYLFI